MVLALFPLRSGAFAAGPGAPATPVHATVVELFTSQGCASCPPADAFLAELAGRKDIIALSFHVNYWDYIGWRDPFASDAATARQRAYSRALHQRYVYTPQMVIDGAVQEVGSRRGRITRLIARRAGRSHNRVAVSAHADRDGRLTVSIPGGDYGGPGADYGGRASVWLFEFDAEEVTRVGRGENRGRTLKNVNVVREIRRIGWWTGAPLDLSVALTDLTDGTRDGCAIVLQAGSAGPILGVAVVPLSAPR